MDNALPLKNLARIFFIPAVIGLLIRIVNIGNPLNEWGDDATYALLARSLMSGELPYHDAFDHKPIALYYIFAFFFQIFGYTLTAIRLMPFAAILLTSWVLHKIAKKQYSSHQHSACVILFMTACASFGNGGLDSNTEILQMPIFAGWWLAALNFPGSSRWRPLLLGALTGLAAQINYLGGFVLAISTALVLGWPLFASASRMTLRSVIVAGLLSFGAFIVVALLVLAPLLLAQDLSQYFEMQLAYLNAYPGALTQDKLIRAIFSVAIPASFFVSLLGCIAWHERSLHNVPPSSAKLLAQLASVFAVTLFVISLTKRLYPHYFNLLIVPSTLILLVLLDHAGTRALRSFACLAGVLATLLVARGAWDVYLKDWNNDFRHQNEIAQLTAEIRRHAHTRERVLLLNLSQTLYFHADVTPATRFVFRDHIFFERFLSRIDSSPAQEITKALNTKPAFVMACFDGIAAQYRALVDKNLTIDYRDYTLAGYDECRDLKAYYPAPKAKL